MPLLDQKPRLFYTVYSFTRCFVQELLNLLGATNSSGEGAQQSLGVKAEEEELDKEPLRLVSALTHLAPVSNWRHTTFELLHRQESRGDDDHHLKSAVAEERLQPPKSLATFTTCEAAAETDIFNECFEKDQQLRSKVTEVDGM
jgi:hypothetical protein